jgi:hypothetical protein
MDDQDKRAIDIIRRAAEHIESPEYVTALTTAQAEADALRAEVERLREVLEMLAPSLDYLPHPQCVEAIDAVRAAGVKKGS